MEKIETFDYLLNMIFLASFKFWSALSNFFLMLAVVEFRVIVLSESSPRAWPWLWTWLWFSAALTANLLLISSFSSFCSRMTILIFAISFAAALFFFTHS